MGRLRAYRMRSSIARYEAFAGIPALQGAHVDAGRLAGQAQPVAGLVRGGDIMGQRLAIFEVDHSSSPVLKIAATFFDSTSSAAVSANARSRRRSSRSSSLIRRRSCWVCCGLARASSGSASACVALCRQQASSCGYTPLARHHALLPASSIAAVVSTASNRPAAVQARSRAGLDSASLRQRSSVPTPTPTSCATSSNAALSGGSNRATALSLNACPYFANSFSHHRPRFMDSIGATSILTRGGVNAVFVYRKESARHVFDATSLFGARFRLKPCLLLDDAGLFFRGPPQDRSLRAVHFNRKMEPIDAAVFPLGNESWDPLLRFFSPQQ